MILIVFSVFSAALLSGSAADLLLSFFFSRLFLTKPFVLFKSVGYL